MTERAPAFVVRQLHAVLRETFEGPQAKWTYFIDNKPDAAVFGTIEALTAEDASRPLGTGESTIASHVHHLAFALAEAADFLRGQRGDVDWSESWRVRTVDEAGWTALKARLRAEYERLLRAVDDAAASGEEAFGGAVGVLAHAAYHLGAIRQKRAAATTR
jgi:DinB family protein